MCLKVQNFFLAFKIESIAIAIDYFTELRASLTVFICKGILLINKLRILISQTNFATFLNL
jgi:hypothetical protein